MPRRLKGSVLVLFALSTIVLTASVTQAAPGGKPGKPGKVTSKADAAVAKLDSKLRAKVESGSNERVPVFATAVGDVAAAKNLLTDAAAAESEGTALIVGTIAVQQLPKLAGLGGIVAVAPVELKQTGQPLGVPDPELNNLPSQAELAALGKKLRDGEVTYEQAPKPKKSNFDKLKNDAVLDAKTHNFVGAWKAGFTGEGVTVGVLDGGTDFGHPDLLNTWQVWENAPDPGWNGWPKAFDPYGTLIWLAAPQFVDQGLSWYTKTEAKTCPAVGPGPKKGPKAQQCVVTFDARQGPSRNFAAPSTSVTHEYSFPAAWSKSGDVRLGNHPDDHLLLAYGERPSFLVVDSKQAGQYDTVYVDLDNDYSFADEKPVTKDSPASYRDMNGDGLNDISGGLLFYISDGATAVPGGLHAFGIFDTSYGPGELLAWTGDYDPAIGGHGTLTASNIVGQGVINGLAPQFDDLHPSPKKSGTYDGAVLGGAPNAKLAPYGDIYFSFEFSTQFGYFLATRNGVDVTSNSYGSSAVDNDGFDAASQEADIIHNGRRTTPLFSTGNGAPGFGTTAPPSPSAGISVGASTQFGATGWDSIANYSQVTDNDVIPWSNRGPGATGSTGVDVVADGAYSSGDVTLNAVFNGDTAWVSWGGTSRSAPVAAGATALIYESYRKASGAVPAGFYTKAKEILKSSALDLGYDTMIQGSGSVDAGKAVATAAATRASVSPSDWRVGDYRGTEYPVFSHVIAPGGSDTQTFAVNGPGTWQVSDRYLKRTGSTTIPFTSENIAVESPYNFNAPNYLIDVSDAIGDNADADLMVVRMTYPHDQFDPDGNYSQNQLWRLLAYDWTDVNGDGNLWTDDDGDGTVDFGQKTTSSNIDGFLDVDYAGAEIDQFEYVRFSYLNNASNSLQVFVRDPAQRMSDGLFIGLQHPSRSAAIPTTDMTFQVDFYENVDWPWLTTPSSAAGSFAASINVPAGTPLGVYSGGIELTKGDDAIVVPVSVAVAGQTEVDSEGNLSGSLSFGGEDVAAAQSDMLYNNGSIFGANTWAWRAESGDWRFFYFDVVGEPKDGSLFLVNTTWDDAAPPTDIDTLVLGRSQNQFQVLADGVFGAPYILDTVGGSPNTHLGSGRWAFNTATGGASDFVTAPAQEGLHALALHGVGWDGGKFHTPFESVVGSASVSPSAVDEETATDTGSFEVTFEASVDLPGLVGEAFGLSQPVEEDVTVTQDNPNDPSSASVKRNVTIDHASRFTVETTLDQDLDLWVVRDANGDGVFTNAEIVASSATGTGNEFVELVAPLDGEYQVWLQGWSITGTPTAGLRIEAIQGNDLTVSGLPAGPVPAGTSVTLTVEYDKAMTAGETYFGELLLGPPSAPSALTVPIRLTKTASE